MVAIWMTESSQPSPVPSSSAAFAQLATRLSGQTDVEEVIASVLEFALRVVPCDVAGLMLNQCGTSFDTMNAPDPRLEKEDRLETDCGKDSCRPPGVHECFLIGDTAAGQTWPGRGPRLADFGLRSVLSLPLFVGQTTIGALNLYVNQPGRFAAGQNAIAHILARHAAITIDNIQQASTLRHAAQARGLIGQAQGILMERLHTDPEHASAALRRYAHDNNINIVDMALRLISNCDRSVHRQAVDGGSSMRHVTEATACHSTCTK